MDSVDEIKYAPEPSAYVMDEIVDWLTAERDEYGVTHTREITFVGAQHSKDDHVENILKLHSMVLL